MPTKKEKIYSFMVLVLLLFTAGGNIHTLFTSYDSVFPVILAALALLAMVSALYYCFRGYSKNAAPSYKAYMIISAVYFQALCCGNAATMSEEMGKVVISFLVLTNSLLFGLFLLLGIAKDMGKKQTTAICAIALALTFVDFVLSLIVSIGSADAAVAHLFGARGLTRFLLVAIACTMAYFKYVDKEKRNAK